MVYKDKDKTLLPPTEKIKLTNTLHPTTSPIWTNTKIYTHIWKSLKKYGIDIGYYKHSNYGNSWIRKQNIETRVAFSSARIQ